MNREIKIIIKTDGNKELSNKQAAEAQKIVNILYNNYGAIKFEHLIGFWIIFKKAPNDFINLAKSIAQDGIKGLASAAKAMGSIIIKVRKK
ncbi:MAG: hypothetical protein R3Y08_08330 [Rikenellaceae bacterium]